jgi:hypothetical protein
MSNINLLLLLSPVIVIIILFLSSSAYRKDNYVTDSTDYDFSTKIKTTYLHKINDITIANAIYGDASFKDYTYSNITAKFTFSKEIIYLDIFGSRDAHKGQYMINNVSELSYSEKGVNLHVKCCNGEYLFLLLISFGELDFH